MTTSEIRQDLLDGVATRVRAAIRQAVGDDVGSTIQIPKQPIMHDLYRLSNALKEGIPRDLYEWSPATLLDRCREVIDAVPATPVTQKLVYHPTARSRYKPSMVLPDITNARVRPDDLVDLNLQIKTLLAAMPGTEQGLRILRARLTVLAIGYSVILLARLPEAEKALLPFTMGSVLTTYEHFRRMYLW